MRAARWLLTGWFAGLVACLGGCGAQHGEEPRATLQSDAAHEPQVLALSEQQITAAGIEIATAGPVTLREELPLYGTIVPNAERVRQVAARFPGVIQSVAKRSGDAVKQGERLATIESNESLRSYALLSPLAGVVIERMANEGEQTGAAALFTVADLSSVWAEIALFPRDVSKVRVGQTVLVRSSDAAPSVAGRMVYLAPLGSSNQTITGRVLLDNTQGHWAPGLFVTATVVIGEAAASVAVRNSAVQTLDAAPVVFLRTAHGFEPRGVRLGRRDTQHSEVLEGVQAGERYAAGNSFVLKSELGKAEAHHDH